MYLIMRCDELGDQYECDANREPIAITSDWENWLKENNPDYLFEVYSWDGTSMECIKDYDSFMEEGMAFYWWYEDKEDCEIDPPHVITKWPNYNRKNKIPNEVMKFKNYFDEEYKSDLKSCGCFSFFKDDKYYVYGKYEDSHYDVGF